jgi:hypothetical protein
MGIEEDLQELDNNLRKLIFEYNQFITGLETKPPYELENRVNFLIRHYLHRKMGRVEHKHRFQNLVRSYRTHKNMWERRLGYREKGLDHLGRTMPMEPEFGAGPESSPDSAEKMPEKQQVQEKTAEAMAKTKKKIPEGVVFKAVTKNPARESKFLDKMFNTYVKAQKLSGKPVKSLNKDNFTKLIGNQVDQIKKKAKCDSVRFRIEMTDGKVKLKASPVKNSKK